MLDRVFTHCVLRPGDLKPVRDGTRVVGAFNPGVARFGGELVLLVRVAEEITERRAGYLPSPRMEPDCRLTVDWLPSEDLDLSDPRVYTRTCDGHLRLRFISHLQVVRSQDGRTPDPDGDKRCLIMPEGEYEEYGIEDPRITRIGQTYYITYVGVSRYGVATCMMSTTDFNTFKRHGIMFCPDNKDVLLFPDRIAGNYLALHRPMPSMKFTTPQIWIATSPDLMHWGGHQPVRVGRGGGNGHSDRIGGSTPPVRTEHGWLTLYHEACKCPEDPGTGTYTVGALLLDLDNPRKIVAQSTEPIMIPTTPFETHGFVNHIVFPTAMIDHEDHYLVYYGAADENVGVTAFDKKQLLAAMES